MKPLSTENLVLRTKDIERFWSKVEKLADIDLCWEWKAGKRNGYGRIKVGNTVYTAHRIAYIIEHGFVSEHLSVCHSCDNPGCCNPNHLFLGTHLDNMQDCKTKGRRPSGPEFGKKMSGIHNRAYTHPETIIRGEQHHMAKLNADQVIVLRSQYASGVKLADLCRQYGLRHSSIQDIVHRVTWRHVK